MAASLISITRRLAWLILGFGLVLHLTIKDGVDVLAVVFYVLTLPLLLVIAAALGWVPGGSARGRRNARGLALVLGVWWSVHSWNWHTAPPEQRLPGEVRVLFWNLSRPAGPLKPLADLVAEFDPDVIGCTEPCDKGRRPVLADWQKLLPGYSARPAFDELLWFTRGLPLTEKTSRLAGLGSFADLQVPLNGKPVRIGLVDVWAEPRVPRTGQIRDAFAHVHTDLSAIVMGDFNTPDDSVHFEAWRDAGFQDSFKEAGRGWRETWFHRIPFLSFDHVWAGKDWRVIDCRKAWSLSSDHAALMVRLVPR